MGYNLNFLVRLLHKSYFICFTLLASIATYLFVQVYFNYEQMKEWKYIYNILMGLGIIVYLTFLSHFKNKIDILIYKENDEQVLLPLALQAILYGVISPFSLVNYYVIYSIVINNNQAILNKYLNKENKYSISLLLLKVAFYLFILHMFVVYINRLIMIYNMIVNNRVNISFSFVFGFMMLIVWLILIRMSIKFLSENKYIESSIISLIVALFTNPFKIHSLFLIASAIIILMKDKNYEKLKERIIEMKEKVAKLNQK